MCVRARAPIYRNKYTELSIVDDTINKRVNSCEQAKNVK